MNMGMGMGTDQGTNSDTGMRMDQGSSSCKSTMLWNWYTVDSCFISEQWHVRSEVVFALSVICVFALGASIEGIRRVGRGYDRRIVRHSREADYRFTKAETLESPSFAFKLSHKQQFVRALLFTLQLGAAYMAMLVAMSYNGFVIFAIILGGGVGHFAFGRDIITGAVGGH